MPFLSPNKHHQKAIQEKTIQSHIKDQLLLTNPRYVLHHGKCAANKSG